LEAFVNIEEEADAAGDAYYDKKMNESAWDDSALMKEKLRTMQKSLVKAFTTTSHLSSAR
jgi:hypothetical protein